MRTPPPTSARPWGGFSPPEEGFRGPPRQEEVLTPQNGQIWGWVCGAYRVPKVGIGNARSSELVSSARRYLGVVKDKFGGISFFFGDGVFCFGVYF